MKNTMVKILGISIVAIFMLTPGVLAAVNTTNEVTINLRGGFGGAQCKVVNNADEEIEITYRIIGITILNTTKSYDVTNSTTIGAGESSKFVIAPPISDLAIIYVEVAYGGGKVYKYGISAMNLVVLPWSDY